MSSLNAGDQLLHFRTIKKLGQGGMGEVYLAEDLKLGRKVALKVLPDSAMTNPKARRRLMQEARSASALNHPNIVTIHSIEEFNGIDFIVMEYVEGNTLAAVLMQGVLDFPKYLDLTAQIGEGLGAAHEAGVIHRDIKSSNILVTNQGQVKILDFGLAKLILIAPEDMPTGEGGLTEEGSILGTVSYMSPEQVRGDFLDSQSDLFSFGCVLYEAATGRLPFRGPNPTSIMYQIVNGPVVPPSSLRPDLPAELDAIVLRALAKDKTLRYTKAREIADHLRTLSFPHTEVISASIFAASTVSRQQPFVGRQPEIERLQQSFVDVMQHSGKTVFLVGEPGIGKTALAEYFLQTIEMGYPEVLIARGRCVEHFGTGEAYLPFLDAIGTALTSGAKDRLTQVLRTHAPTWCMQFPAAFTSTGVLENSQKEAAAASKERMLRELSDALIELTTGYPLILFLEDLHWADPSSADLLRYLARRMKGHRLLILGTMREEDLAGNPPMKACRLDLQANSLSEDIRLNLLLQSQISDYLNAFHSPNAFPEDFSRILFKKTEGHPLFITGLLQFLVNQGILEKKSQVWTLTKSLSEMDLEVPENVRSMIRRKMEALSEEDRRVLQFAAVEGSEFSSIVLSELLNVDEIALEEQLNRIEKNYRMIVRTEEEDWPDGSLVTKYRFAHALYQNAFYSDLVTKRRIQLHKLAGESLLKHHGGKATSIANKLGTHFRIGRDFEKAVQYLAIAGDQAKAVYANAEAENLYGQTLAQVEDLMKKDPSTWKAMACTLHEKRADALSMLGKQPDAKSELATAVLLADAADVITLARLNRKTAKVVETQRQFKEAFELYERAEALLTPDLDKRAVEWKREWLQIYLDRSWLYYTQNLRKEMERDIPIMESYVKSVGTPMQQFRFYINSILSAYRRERYRISEETLAIVDLSRKAAVEIGNASNIAELNFVTGFARLWHGDLDVSEEHLKISLAQASRLEDAVLQSRCLTYLTVLYRKRGNLELTQSFATRSLEHSTTINMQEYVAAAKSNLAWVFWRSKQLEQAKNLATEAIQIWQSLTVASPFQDLAAWPLVAICLQEENVTDACRYAGILLQPAQRQQDPEVEKSIQAAIDADRSGDPALVKEKLLHAANIVEGQGYL